MSLMLTVQGTGRGERELAEVAVHAMAAVLAANGVESRCACPEDFGCLQITSVPGVASFISVDEDGDATWEYRLSNGAAPGPERIIGMTMKILGAGEPDYDDPPIERDCLTLKGIAGRALRDRGMQAELRIIGQDDANFDVFPEIWVANPARLVRGMVRADDDGVIRWECRLRRAGAKSGRIAPAEFAGTIARILTGNLKPRAVR